MKSKQQILEGYRLAGKDAKESRELLFYQAQKVGKIPLDLPYSDDNYYDYLAGALIDKPADMVLNEYLTNIYNKLALIDFSTIAGNRDDIFQEGLKQYVPAGDTIEIQFTDISETEGYDKLKFVPDKLIGGDLVQSMRITLSSVVGTANLDKRVLPKVIPTAIIQQALLPAITSGLANGWPSIFDEQMRRTWEKFRFDRARQLISRAGGEPQGATRNEWFNPATTWKKNDAQFIKITKPITDADTFQDFLIQLYSTSIDMYADYQTKYNVAGIPQIVDVKDQSIYMDASLWSYWKTTNSVLFNSDKIDVQTAYKQIKWLKLLPSTIDPKITTIRAVLYVDDAFRHYPFLNAGQGAQRLVQMWASNITTSIYDHFWLASGIDLSKNIVVFYEESSAKQLGVKK